jgi:hypothetical protein
MLLDQVELVWEPELVMVLQLVLELRLVRRLGLPLGWLWESELEPRLVLRFRLVCWLMLEWMLMSVVMSILVRLLPSV